MASQFKVERRVEFFETDLAGIMHFSNFFRYMEFAEHEFYRSIGIPIHSREKGDQLGWPRVHAECNYKTALYFEDIVEITLNVEKMTEKTVQYRFEFHKLNCDPVLEVATGQLTVACVRCSATNEKMKAIPIPDTIANKIESRRASMPVND